MFFINSYSILLTILIGAKINSIWACNGFKAKIKKIENCAGADSVISIDPDFSIKLNKKCELIPSGCVNNKAFNTATAKYSVKKNGLLLKQGAVDICKAATGLDDDSKKLMSLFGVPDKCPVAKQEVCVGDQKINLSKYRAMLSMARGNTIVDLDVTHDTGKSCYHIEMEIKR